MSAYSDAILARNPVGYWRLGETSGTNANDESSNNNGGTYTSVTLNQTSLLEGDANPAVRFEDTIIRKVEVPRIAAYEIADSLTLTLWMKPTSPDPGGSNRAVVVYNLNDDPWPWGFHHAGHLGHPQAYQFTTGHSGTGNDQLFSSSSGTDPGPKAEFPHDEVAFVVCTYDGTRKQIFKNGCLVRYRDITDGPIDTYVSDQKIIMGMGPFGNNATWDWHGYLDEVAVFDTVLDDDDVKSLWQIGSQSLLGGCLPGGPVWGLATGGPALHLL